MERVVITLALLFPYCIFSTPGTALQPSAKCTAVSPVPKRAICNTRARLSGSNHTLFSYGRDDLGALQNLTQEKCLDICLRRRTYTGQTSGLLIEDFGCAAVAYNETSKICMPSIYNLTHTRHGIGNFTPDPTSDTIFWTPICFKCPSPCPQQPVSLAAIDSGNQTGNLLDNGSFDNSPSIAFSGPWYFGSSTSAHERLVHRKGGANSSRAFELTPIPYITPNGPNWPSQAYQSCDKQRYLIKFDWKVPIPVRHSSFLSIGGNYNYAEIFDPDWQFSIYADPDHADPLIGSWVTSELSFQPNFGSGPAYGNATLRVASDKSDAGRYFVDNFAVYPIETSIQTNPETELITNGGFQTGDLSNWTELDVNDPGGPYNAVVLPKNVSHFSTYALEFTDGSNGISQNFTTKLGTRYVLSLDYALTCGSTVQSYSLPGLFLNSEYGTDYSWTQTFATKNGTQYVKFENIFRSMRTEYELVIAIYSFECPLYVDNVSIKEAT